MHRRADHGDIKEQHVLVLGGAGFLGSVLVRRLLDLRYTVTVYDSFLYDRNSLEGIDAGDLFSVVRGDIRDAARLAEVIEGKHVVVNLAAIVGDAACDLDPTAAQDINAHANRTIYSLAHDYGVDRFICASTCSVYGFSDNLLGETSFLNPVSLYAQTKLTSELLLMSARHKVDTALTVLRFATLFGWSYRPRFDLVVNTMTGHSMSEGAVTIFGGNQWRPHLHVRDAADAIISAVEAPRERVDAEIFNVGGNALNMTVRELGETVARMVPGCRVESRPEAIDPRNYLVDFGKIRTTLGFRPRYDIRDGVEEIARNAKRHSIVDFGDARFSNAASLRALQHNGFVATSGNAPVAVPARR